MPFCLYVPLKDYLKLCLGHPVLRNIRREAVGYRSYREEYVSKSAKMRRSSYVIYIPQNPFRFPC
jgi:hypothetical protein